MDPETNDAGKQRVERPTVTRRRLLATGGATLGAGIGIAGCVGLDDGADEPQTENQETLTITDSVGRKVTVPSPPERIALLNTTLYWTVTLLGVDDSIVATSGDSAEFPTLAEKPDAGWWRDPNYEVIAGEEPDVLITSWTGSRGRESIEEIADQLDPFDIPVVCLGTDGIEHEQAQVFADILGETETVQEFFNWRDDHLSQVEDEITNIPQADRPLVFYESQSTEWEARHAEPIELAGGRNVLEAVVDDETELQPGESRTVDQEFIVTQDPDVILKEDSGGPPRVTGYEVEDDSGAQALREEVLDREAVNSISAVHDGSVHTIGFTVTFYEKSWLGALYLAKLFHPDRFEELDPVAVHREYHEEWLDVPHQGVYLVPRHS